MEIKSLSIGRLTTKNNIFLAPLAGFSDYAFRSICYSLGAGLCFTEMVSAKGLIYNSENTKKLLYTTDDEYIKAVQLFGNDPKVFSQAIKRPELQKFDIIDINMGCPVPKVFNNGEGSKLLDNPSLAGELVASLKESGKAVTVKTRLGITRGEPKVKALIKAVTDNGASLVTVHGRYREDYYSGEVYYDLIKEVVDLSPVPVIANGGIFSKFDADLIMEKTNAAGIMLARGALNKPWLFSELLSKPVKDKKSLIKRHIDLLLEQNEDKFVATYMRKQMALYLAGLKDAKRYKTMVFEAKSTKELKDIINRLEL